MMRKAKQNKHAGTHTTSSLFSEHLSCRKGELDLAPCWTAHDCLPTCFGVKFGPLPVRGVVFFPQVSLG